MQLLRLILNILVGMSLSINMCDVLASSAAGSGAWKKPYHTYSKEKASSNSGDVWERIRLGMKTPGLNTAHILSGQNLISGKNSFANAYLYAAPQEPEVETLDAEKKRPEAAKYIIHPNTVIAPMNNYTALGLRLKFGTKVPSATEDNCTQSNLMQVRQAQAFKSNNSGATNAANIPLRDSEPQLRKHTVLAAPSNGNLQASSEMTNSQTTNVVMPCGKRTEQQLVGVSNQEMPRQFVEPNSVKKTMINERINKQIVLFRQSPGYLYQVAERARPYLYHIVEGLSKNQLPLELALLPIVESGYQPMAFSPKGAAGLWQFIASTGKDYDLKQSNHYDDRLDILASTQAAIRFLSDLKEHFNGDWLLALAAYNCGQGTVDRAISRNLAEGLDTDYWSLRLPEETQDYVPRLLALSNIFASPAIYGLKFSPIKNEPYFVKVKINREVDMKYLTDKNFTVLAKLANLSHEQFSRLNPGYLNPALSTQPSYTFLLPLANAKQLHLLLTSIAQFMAEPVSLSMDNSNSEAKIFPYSWNLSPNPTSINLIRFSGLSQDI